MQRISLICLLFLLFSCENQVDIHFSGDKIPVAYCILDLQDSIQQISLSQSYLPDYEGKENGVGIADFKELSGYSAYVEMWDNEDVREIYYFENSGINDPPGEPDSIYRMILESSFTVNYGVRYKLYVVDDQDEEVFSGETVTVGNLKVLDPLLVPGRELTLTLDQGYFMSWEPPGYARVYQPIVYFNYLESDFETVRKKQLKIPLSININSEQIHVIRQFMSGRHFFLAVREGIPYVPGLRRKAENLDFEILAGGEELSIYLGKEIYGTSDFGQLNEYGNFDDAKGIFSSRSSAWVRGIELSYITHDSLATGLYTRQLGFIPSGEEL